METILIDVSQVFHSQAEHGLLRSVYSLRLDFVPLSGFVDVDIDGPSDFPVLLKVLRRSHHDVLPTKKQGVVRKYTVIALFNAGCVY